MDKSFLENNEYTMCFACGKDNKQGLHMHFDINEERCEAHFVPQPEHQSYFGRMHGGLVAVLLDEVTGNYLYCKEGIPAVTAKMEIRYRKPLIIGEEVICTGWEERRRGKMVIMRGKIENREGAVLAESVSSMMVTEL